LLRASIGLNGFDRVRPVRAAESDAAGFLEFTELGAYGVVASCTWSIRIPPRFCSALKARDSGHGKSTKAI
jgi:hypothetical protein